MARGIWSRQGMLCGIMAIIAGVDLSSLWPYKISLVYFLLILYLLYGAFVGGLPTWAQCVFAAAVAIVYHVTMIFEKKQMWRHKTWMHLFFRYIGYWWIHVSLVHEKYPLRSFFFLSLVYYSHIILKMTCGIYLKI